MGEPYVIFNGKSSREIGVVVEMLPDFSRPMRNVELIQVPGRDGRLERDDRTHDVYTTPMKINCFGVPLNEVYAWLSGASWLVSSDEPDRAVWASMHMQIKPTRFRCGKCYDSLTCTVYCQPYRYFYPEVEDVVLTVASSAVGEILNPGTWESDPVITIEGTGDVSLMIGQYQMDFEGLTDGIVVDCELQECFSLDRAQLMNAHADIAEFPKLQPGMNYLQWTGSGRISKITVRRRCRDV